MTQQGARLGLTLMALLSLAGCNLQSTEITLIGDPDSRGEWDDLLDHADTKNIEFGVKLLGPSPFERETHTPFAPASNTKLYTTAEALSLLGASHRFSTSVRWNAWPEDSGIAHDLRILGSGDPTWGSSHFGQSLNTPAERIAREIQNQGIREVRGLRAISDDPRWARLRYPRGWQPEDRTACYAALAQSINLHENCATYVIRGVDRGSWAEAEVPVRVDLEIRPGSKTSLEVVALDSVDLVGDRFVIRGTWSAKQSAVAVRLPIHRSGHWFERLLARELERRGIRVTPLDSSVRGGGSHEFIHSSPPLSEILVPFLKHSVNLIGHALFKAMGSQFGDPGQPDLLTASQNVMREFIETLGDSAAARLGTRSIRGFFSDHVALWDGSGISHDNEVSVEAMMSLLQDLSAETPFESLWRSLPIAGVDGTLAGRMRGTAAQGVLRAKTGTLSGVYNLSGYVPRLRPGDEPPSEVVPFVILTRAPPGSSKPARAAQDRVGARLAEIVNSRDFPSIFWPVSDLP